MQTSETIRICLWSCPRNVSTALMYSFAQREDTRVYDEPMYAHYLHQTNAAEYHPGASEVLAAMENDGMKVVEMMQGEHDRPVVFFKGMTHHLLNLDRSFMKGMVNVILTRDPKEMLPSFAKVIATPGMKDVGYEDHTELLQYLESIGQPPVVMDSKTLLMNPEKTLARLCELIGIPFDAGMLHWEAGARPEDGVWAKYWYGNVHQSTGFMKYSPKTEPFPDKLKPLLKACQPHYQRLLEYSMG